MRLKRYEIPQDFVADEVVGPNDCSGCGNPTSLVQYSDGGFVKATCENCPDEATLSNEAFLSHGWARSQNCPSCQGLMEPAVAAYDYGNFVLECSDCQHFVRVADLVPKHDRIAPG